MKNQSQGGRFGFRGSLTATTDGSASRSTSPFPANLGSGALTTGPEPARISSGRRDSHRPPGANLADHRAPVRWSAEPSERLPFSGIDDVRSESLPLREQSLLKFILGQEPLRFALSEGPTVELRATGYALGGFLLPSIMGLEINSDDAAEALTAVSGLNDELSSILVHNALQFLSETRQFLGLCFSKLSVGGTLIITVPHQFLYERKLRLPSRRNRLHRRFYTANTLLADIEEAIDPCQYRVRFLGENDAGFDYGAELNSDADGGQDIVVALEKLARPAWRSDMGGDEVPVVARAKRLRIVELKTREPGPIRTIAPDRRGVDRILLLKLDHRGDFLLATEAFKVFRHTYDKAHVTLVCGSWNVGEAEKTGYFDKIIPFDFFSEDESARLETASPDVLTKKFAKLVGDEHYDLAVDLRLYDDTRELLQTINARNRAGFDRCDSFPWLSIRLNTPAVSFDDRAEAGLFAADRFSTAVCTHRTYEIAADAPFSPQKTQAIIWGPYEELKPGRYQFECLIEPLAEDFEIAFDIAMDSGTRTILAGLLRGRYPRLDLQIDERFEKFEFRLVGRAGFEVKPFRFSGIRFVRPSIIRAVHQSEAMALLAHLVRLRLHDAYRAELA